MKRDLVAYVGAGLVVLVMLMVLFNGIGITGNAVSRTKGACRDTDSKNDIYTFGVVNFETRTSTDSYPDTCLSDGRHLRQYVCKTLNRLSSDSFNCPKGCANGVCLK